jgi:hypothetical protein
MILLDDSIIFTALPKIHAAMQFSPGGLDWVFRQRAGWPRAMSAITLARELFTSGGDQ